MSTPHPAPGPELAPRVDVVDELHGTAVPDPYRWLEDAADERTVAWSRAQDEAWEAWAAALPGRERLERRVRELMATGSVGTPVHRGERVFRTRREPTAEHAVLLVTDPGAAPRVLVDPVALDPSGTTTLDAWRPDVEGDLLAYQLSEGGSEESVLRVLDVATGEVVDGPIDRARYSPVAWLPADGDRAPSTTCGGCRRSSCPPTSGSTTAACTCTSWAPTPRPTWRSSARAGR